MWPLLLVASLVVMTLGAYGMGIARGRREERGRWVRAATKVRWLFVDGVDYTVMVQSDFWTEYHNPLVRLRRAAKEAAGS
jgi:hypothetical protein